MTSLSSTILTYSNFNTIFFYGINSIIIINIIASNKYKSISDLINKLLTLIIKKKTYWGTDLFN